MRQFKWYFEDFTPGRTIHVGTRLVEEQEIIDFARQFDPQPFHVDKAAGEQSIYGGLIASGWHTCGMMMRMMVDGFMREAASLGSPGVDEIRWLKPVRAGDTLSVTTTVLDARPSASKPDRGVVHTMWEAKNQHGETVTTVKGMGMFMRRPKEAA
ncbi:Acyl dehydratase [Noviherbaspirillum humi]|uniref:Acyl dehydratase n=1 Tax=Noviherbaspirillum humi TaxID=1688639 RepID=A0A239H314_9BURK|nr:MaoC family dehydratase [Noviherbaspirillum humi]SNS75572.1 Acyl dehydratase [Noviherbaspirillum humi]